MLIPKGIGRKNAVFGAALFSFWALFYVVLWLSGISLDSLNSRATLKTVHAYGLFLGTINYFFGFLINNLKNSNRNKQIASYSFILAGVLTGLIKATKFSGIAFTGDIFFALGLLIFIKGKK